ncbi:MAG: hypothetical protein IKU54_04035 [Oscillospiraceae bacterium]|nr:hypothetical protein [Oscillospiraceae bacterium]
MRRVVYFIISIIYITSLCACSQSTNNKVENSWNFSVICSEKQSDDIVLSYINENIVSTTGSLTFENKNDFDIIVHLIADGNERVQKITSNGVSTLFQISTNVEYTIGCYADVPEGTAIELFVYDGEGNTLSNYDVELSKEKERTNRKKIILATILALSGRKHILLDNVSRNSAELLEQKKNNEQ